MYTILIIEDDLNLREEATDLLELEGYEVLGAGNGIEGLAIARDHLPDLILCDINMPELDGYSVLEELHSDFLTATIPFIFISANSLDKDVREGMNLGADDYLTKPFTNIDLLNAVRSRLKRSEIYELNQMRGFAHELVSLQEVERQNLANILKNNLGEMLTDLKLTLNLLDRLPAQAQKSTIETSQQLLNHVLSEIDIVSHSLYPTTIQRLGLIPSIFLLIEQLEDRTELDIQFENKGLDNLPNTGERLIAIYRIIQEALHNIEKHARATTVEIRLWAEDDKLRLQIIDDGQGFNLERALQDRQNIGLIGMRERATLLNGDLTILSEQNIGTQIIAEFPLTLTATLNRQHSDIQPPKVNVRLPDIKADTPKKASNSIAVAIAESNDIRRWGLHNAVNSHHGFEVTHLASDTEELYAVLNKHDIDVLILSQSIQIEDADKTFLSTLKQSYPNIPIIMLAHFNEYNYASETLKHGASGYLLRTSNVDEIIQALQLVVDGKQYIAKDVMATMDRVNQNTESNNDLDAFSTLTDREREVFYLVVNGHTNKEIADQLFISPRTAETHRRNMMRKLGIRGTHNLIHFAMNRGFIGN